MDKVVLSSYGGGSASESQQAGTIRSLVRWLNRPPHLTDEQMQMGVSCFGSGCTTPSPHPPLCEMWVFISYPDHWRVSSAALGEEGMLWKYSCHQGYKRCSQNVRANPVWMHRIDAQPGMNKMMKTYLLNNRLKYKIWLCVMTHSSMNDQQE